MNIISSLLSNLNYGTIFFLMMLESTVVPVPSEFVVTPAAYHAASGQLDVWLVILAATIGADLGASINYIVAIKQVLLVGEYNSAVSWDVDMLFAPLLNLRNI